MAINKVEINDGGTKKTLIDLTGDSITPESLVKGYTAHGADGEPVNGANPYELNATNAEVEVQTELVEQILTALEGKAAGGGIIPTGTMQITENGVYDVTKYAGVDVNVPTSGGAEEEWIGDGNTHIWIRLDGGRTSPMLGCCPNGTVTVDWGDGTTPDILTGTSTTTVKWTPNHNYAAPGEYVITLTVRGELGLYGSSHNKLGSAIIRYSSQNDDLNYAYRTCVQKVEIGSNVTHIETGAFCYCYGLTKISIPNSVTSLALCMFQYCTGVRDIVIPSSITIIDSQAFAHCYCIYDITIPRNVTSIGNYAFQCCYGLAKIRFEQTTPPTVGGSDTFRQLPTDCIISVPIGSLEAYMSATNYPNSATYTYIEEA